MRGALLNITLGVLCILGWAASLTFSILRLTGVLEIAPDTGGTIALALLPLALGFPLGVEMIERGMRDLAPGLTTLLAAAFIFVFASTLPRWERITDWIAGATDRITERTSQP